jgi:prepilin-type N-terminal cleavage/methylation domain-containing protein
MSTNHPCRKIASESVATKAKPHARKLGRIRPAGFTLIEVLVVVAIIALIISILIPALKQAREQAGGAVCLSNIRQLMLGMSAYTSEYGRMPDGMPTLRSGTTRARKMAERPSPSSTGMCN